MSSLLLKDMSCIEVMEDKLNLAGILKKARRDKKLRQEDVANQLGINRSAISNIEIGNYLPSDELLKALAEIYGVPDDDLLQLLDAERRERRLAKESVRYRRSAPVFTQFIFVPIINNIPAGHFIEVSPKTVAEVDDYIPVPSEELANKTGLLGFRVQGPSMNGRGIRNDDIIVIDPAIEPVNGDLVVISVNDEVVLKEYHHKDDKLVLKSANPDFPGIIFPVASNNIKIYGKVITRR